METPRIIKKSVQRKKPIIQAKITQVQKVKYQDAPLVRKVQKTVEVPQIQYVDKVVDMPVIQTQYVDKFVDVPV